MDVILSNLSVGLQVALQPINIFWVTLGGLLGTIVGMLPGLGPATGVAVLLPLTFSMGPVGALITMAGVYYGAMFGGSRSSILINTPGDGAAIASTFDGYPLAMKGKAESALAMSAIASFIGGMIASMIIGNLVCVIINVPLAKLLVRVLSVPARYLFPIVLGLAFIGTYAINNMVTDLFIMIIFGLIGLYMEKADIPTSPMILASIVGGMMEQSFRQARLISGGKWSIFWGSPICVTLIVLTIVSILWPIVKGMKTKKADL